MNARVDFQVLIPLHPFIILILVEIKREVHRHPLIPIIQSVFDKVNGLPALLLQTVNTILISIDRNFIFYFPKPLYRDFLIHLKAKLYFSAFLALMLKV